MLTPLRSVIIILLIGFAIGCRAAPVMNLRDAPVARSGASLGQVERAIRRAAGGLSWQIRRIRPGLLRATKFHKSASATVDIPYSRNVYSVVYSSSQNLKYDGANIHKIYNTWIQQLDQAIQREMLAM